jgi:hypothetical protein
LGDEVRKGKSGSLKVALIDRKSGGEPPRSKLLSYSGKLEPHRDWVRNYDKEADPSLHSG